MEAIKKKIENLRSRLAVAENKANAAEAELAEINEKADNAETVVAEGDKEVNELQNEIGDKEDEIAVLATKLLEAEKNLEESVRAVRVLENRTSSDSRKYGYLAGQLEEAVTKNEDVEAKYLEVSKSIDDLEVSIADADERLSLALERVKELEPEATRLGHDLKRMEISEGKASAGEESASSRIDQLEAELIEMTQRADAGEARVKELENDLGELEIHLDEEKDNYKKQKQIYEDTLAELAEM